MPNRQTKVPVKVIQLIFVYLLPLFLLVLRRDNPNRAILFVNLLRIRVGHFGKIAR